VSQVSDDTVKQTHLASLMKHEHEAHGIEQRWANMWKWHVLFWEGKKSCFVSLEIYIFKYLQNQQGDIWEHISATGDASYCQ
jgi:hypothetical protein